LPVPLIQACVSVFEDKTATSLLTAYGLNVKV
jgi:hypothetical protein